MGSMLKFAEEDVQILWAFLKGPWSLPFEGDLAKPRVP